MQSSWSDNRVEIEPIGGIDLRRHELEIEPINASIECLASVDIVKRIVGVTNGTHGSLASNQRFRSRKF
jgi:hypothetical protein